ncbi:MAG: DUF547 domain-containing protein [Candidatus Abyssubacteria bacterium]
MRHLAIAAFSALVLICSSVGFAESNQKFTYEDYAAVLQNHVNEEGMVNYDSLKENREKLDAFATEVATLKPETYDAWTDAQKIAFWINTYNALTLQVIINHYPIKPGFFGALLYPDNSIRQIPGVWDRITFPVMGEKMTLDEIEHDTLRANFNEPRIHMALVCAAMGCPPLRREPYLGDALDEQLDDQTRRFLKDPEKFRIDPVDGRVYLSSIFKWFGQDFVKTYGAHEKFKGHSESERAVLNFVSAYVDEKLAEFLTTGDYEIEYLDYDWSLNEEENGDG